jgi:multiple antibiotic resistance protein
MLNEFLLSFIPLFVALDALGILPIYIKFAWNLDRKRKNRDIRDSLITAFFITLIFVVVGNKIMGYLGVTINDFLVAGGIVLFVIAAKDILTRQDEDVGENDLFGVVPLGIPLMAGPAVLATSVIITSQHGFLQFIFSLILNLLICGTVLKFSELILKYLGKRFIEAISKVFSLIIASIAIMFIRKGLEGF